MSGAAGAVSFPGGKVGALLEELLLGANRTIAYEVLIDRLWPGEERDRSLSRLRVVVTRLRRLLGEGLQIEPTDGGYLLVADPSRLDAALFEQLVAEGTAGNRSAAVSAINLWRGEPFQGFATSDRLVHEAHRLNTLYRTAETVAGDREPNRPATEGPAPPSRTLRRDRLLRRLPKVGAVRLLLITAPSGFGKTSLLHQWFQEQDAPVSWYSGRSEETPQHMLTRAMAELSPERAPDPSASPDVTEFVNGLGQGSLPAGLILDDFDVTDAQLCRFVERLLMLAPPGFTLVVASRRAIPVPTARLFARGEATMLGPEDLVLTAEEGRQAANLVGHRLTEAEAREMLRASAGVPRILFAVLNGSAGDKPPPVDHLWEEMRQAMFDGVPEQAMEVLRSTAHLNHIDSDLATYVSGVNEAPKYLHELSQEFRLLSETREGYVHLPATARLLRGHFEESEDRRAAHHRTAEWFRAHGDAVRAFEHALAAGHGTDEAKWALEAVMRRGDAKTLDRWLRSKSVWAVVRPPERELLRIGGFLLGKQMPPGKRFATPNGRVVESTIDALRLLRSGDLDRAGAVLDRLKRRPIAATGSGTTLPSFLQTLTAVLGSSRRQLLASRPEAAPRVISGEPQPNWPWLAAWAVGQVSLSTFVTHGVAMADALLEHGKADTAKLHPSWHRLEGGPHALATALLLAETNSDGDRLEDAEEMTRATTDSVDRNEDLPLAAVARYILYRLHHRKGEDESAEAWLAEADALRRRLPQVGFLTGFRRAVTSPRGIRERLDLGGFTGAQLEVMRFLRTGLTYEQIGESLFMSPNTVRTHARAIYARLGVRRRAEAVRLLRDAP